MGRRRARVRRRKRRYVSLIVIGLFLLAALISLALYRSFGSRIGLFSDGEDELTDLPGDRVTFLVMGVDKRPGDVGRSDSMIVVSYDPSAHRIAMLSLPRDTWVEIPGFGYDKLNHSYAFGGEELTVRTVQRFLGIPIDHYVTVSFNGFEQVVDALGGIDIDAEKRMYYYDPFDTGMGEGGLMIDIQPGLQHMDGETALKYARFRMDEEGDLGRIRRQQQVVKAIMEKAKTPSVIARLPQLISALADTVDTDLSVSEMVQLASGAKEALSTPLISGTVQGTNRNMDGVSYQVVDLKEARLDAYKVLVGEEPPEEFVLRAQRDGAEYEQALASAGGVAYNTDSGDALEPGEAGDQETEGTHPEDGTEPGTGKAGEPGDGTGTGQGGGETSEGAGTTPEEGGSTQPAGHPAPYTVSLVDASGLGLADAYASMLSAAGYNVVSTVTIEQTIEHSVVVDYGGAGSGVQAVIPSIMVISAPDPTYEVGIQVVLGRDLGY